MLDVVQVEEGLRVRVLQQNILEERTAGAQDDLVDSDLLVFLSSQCNISKVVILPQVSEGVGSTGFKIIPIQDHFIIGCHPWRIKSQFVTMFDALNFYIGLIYWHLDNVFFSNT